MTGLHKARGAAHQPPGTYTAPHPHTTGLSTQTQQGSHVLTLKSRHTPGEMPITPVKARSCSPARGPYMSKKPAAVAASKAASPAVVQNPQSSTAVGRPAPSTRMFPGQMSPCTTCSGEGESTWANNDN